MGHPEGHRAGPELACLYGLPISSQGILEGIKYFVVQSLPRSYRCIDYKGLTVNMG